MVRALHRLSALGVRTTTSPGLKADGGGLYLRVAKGGSKSWVFVFQWNFRRREMGLGGINAVSLARAREKAAAARTAVADGIDPVQAKRALRQIPTFGAVADVWIKEQTPGVRSDKSVARWKRALGDAGYAKSLRTKRVDHVDTDDVAAVLRPIWSSKHATARTVRSYIEAVLDYAGVKRHRTGDNPARWRGHLEHLLSDTRPRGEGHAALPWQDVPALMSDLAKRPALSARALEFTILCATRTGETIGATWGEFDFENAIWTIPAERMKGGREHTVPLSNSALELLRSLKPANARRSAFVFGGDKPLSNMAMLALLQRRMERADLTVHGFRSAFRDWAGDATDYPREIAEMALAHAVGDATELAYRRGTALEKRRAMMRDWAAFLSTARRSRQLAEAAVPMNIGTGRATFRQTKLF